MSHPSDLREHIKALEALGDLDRIETEVDWNLEAAAHTRYSTEHHLPAPLFEKVTGVADGFRILGAPAALSSAPGKPFARVALSIGLPPEATGRQIVDHLVATRHRPGVPPKTVSRGEAAVKQNVLLGDDADLNRFPVPFVHEGDGDRYVNTYGVIIAQTPDGSWTNWSIARIMMVDGKHMTGLVIHPQHIAQIWQQWADLGRPMPYALVQGGDPAIPYVGGIPIGDGVAEADYIGALIGEPLAVVKAELSDLLVPASAEIVIEGHLSVERTGVEGPFGEFAGYIPSETSLQPVYSVEAITYRDDPIWPLVAEGKPTDDFHTVTGHRRGGRRPGRDPRGRTARHHRLVLPEQRQPLAGRVRPRRLARPPARRHHRGVRPPGRRGDPLHQVRGRPAEGVPARRRRRSRERGRPDVGAGHPGPPR